jgi:hypothetical protein
MGQERAGRDYCVRTLRRAYMLVRIVVTYDGRERLVGWFDGHTLTCKRTVSKHLFRGGYATVREARFAGLLRGGWIARCAMGCWHVVGRCCALIRMRACTDVLWGRCGRKVSL